MEIHAIGETVGAIRMQVRIKSGVTQVNTVGIFKGITLLATWFVGTVIEVLPVEEPVHFSPTKVSATFKFKITKIIFVIWSTISG